MKLIYLSFVASFMIYTSLRGQWKIVNEGTGYVMHTADFINNDIGWMAGDGAILQTTDGGENWTIKNDKWDFYIIDFINDSIGWATTHNRVLKTRDGGRNWIQQIFINDLRTICTVTENMVYATCYKSIFKTTDGGSNWIEITPDVDSLYYDVDFSLNYKKVSFLNPDTGIIVCKRRIFNTFNLVIIKTIDGGKKWNINTIAEFDDIYHVEFVNETLGYFLAIKNYDYDPYIKYFLCKTTDLFNTWNVIAEHNYPVRACHFFNDDEIISILDDSLGNYTMKTENGGISWEKNSTVNLPYLNEYNIYFGAENVGHIIGIGNFRERVSLNINADLLMTSTDKGNTWSYSSLTYPFNNVCFINHEKGFITGGFSSLHLSCGSVFMTQDGGKTWNTVLNPRGAPKNIVFRNDSNGLVTCDWGANYHTSDFGSSWQEYFIVGGSYPPGPTIWDIFLVNEQTAYATVGGTVFKTNDWLQPWKEVHNFHPYHINSMFFINETTGWLSGESGLIIKYMAPGTFEKIVSGTDLPLKKVFFINDTIGWISGGYANVDEGFHPVFLKTDDCGESWIKIENINYLINDFYFRDRQNGWAIGIDSTYSSVILETTDGGDNWIVQVDSLNGLLTAIHFKDGIGWAVGHNGLILTNDPYYTSIAEYQNKENNYNISIQNYPNPFSSSTVISYRLTVNSMIEMDVYDLVGRKVTTLVKEKQQAGLHDFEWNAEGIKPGIYFCELRAVQSRKVMKMILLK